MRTVFGLAVTIAWLAGAQLAPSFDNATPEVGFQSAKAVAVSDVAIPTGSIANGTTVLEVGVSKDGEVNDVQVRRAISAETEEAVRSVRTWRFEPARLNGVAVESSFTVAVTFLPVPPLCADMPLPPLRPRNATPRSGPSFNPPEVTHASFPQCPNLATNMLGPLAVILAAHIDRAGNIQRTEVLRGTAFVGVSTQALERWRFTPAMLAGRPVGADVALVFCFRPPVFVPRQ